MGYGYVQSGFSKIPVETTEHRTYLLSIMVGDAQVLGLLDSGSGRHLY